MITKISIKFIAFIFIWGQITSYCYANEDKKHITIMADPSLNVAINIISRNYILENNLSITTIFSTINEQIKSISKGDASNVIITANPDFMNLVQQHGLIDVFSKRNIVRNNLVLIGSKNNFARPDLKNIKHISDFSNAFNNSSMFVVGDFNKTSEGVYAKKALLNYKLKSLFEPIYVFTSSAYESIQTVSQYDAVGITFRTDVKLFPEVRELQLFDENFYSPPIYQAAAVISENMNESRKFIEYLNSKPARDIFRQHGFTTFF